MLSTLLSILPASLVLLWTSYGPPNGGFIELANLIKSQSELPLSRYMQEVNHGYDLYYGDLFLNGIEIDMSGKCWIGLQAVECSDRLVGNWIRRVLPFLLALQIYYSLLTYTIILGIAFHYTVKKQWATKSELILLRRFTLVVMVIKDFVGVFGVITSLISLLLPFIDPSVDHIVDVKLGWGSIITIFAVFGSGLLTARYEYWSKQMLEREVENGIVLALDEEGADEESNAFSGIGPDYDPEHGVSGIVVENAVEEKVGIVSPSPSIIGQPRAKGPITEETEIDQARANKERSVKELFDRMWIGY
ncbi:uncharacterized protein I303_105711 [Kwoniella dejecticola CBS 10117]|uniref:Uncharacterized protein n=1 Tax=Kwoniella dejecticola CBS 10117 TaxID=1296121 RepID=A0A1A6A065_9TREE|nr:uncharacterized protein I303_05732 [Kwoniella dejecticola CBS 10117]OBR83453.1 hypothetical protein I303_05732 [Kwoniella dejecticola CBS 10117]